MTAVEKSTASEPGGNHFPKLLGKTALRGPGCQPPGPSAAAAGSAPEELWVFPLPPKGTVLLR